MGSALAAGRGHAPRGAAPVGKSPAAGPPGAGSLACAGRRRHLSPPADRGNAGAAGEYHFHSFPPKRKRHSTFQKTDLMPTVSLRTLALAALLAGVGAAPAAAQAMPGGAPTDTRAHRRAFLSEVYQNVAALVEAWKAAWEGDDPRALAALYAQDAVLFPYEGEHAAGRAAVQALLTEQLARSRDLRSVMIDFTASGSLAYYAGRFTYTVQDPAGGTHVASGTYVLVMERDGSRWKIRSHVERPDLTAVRADLAAAQVPAPATESAVAAPAAPAATSAEP